MSVSEEAAAVQGPSAGESSVSAWTYAAFVVALVALLGSLWLSMGMGLKACPLCFYQRTFVMAVVGILGLGVLTGAGKVPGLSVLALPSAVGGLCVAGFHVYLESQGRLECPAGVFGLGSAPQQSLAALALLTALVAIDGLRSAKTRRAWILGLILGVAFAIAAVRSSPPMKVPTEPYKEALDICRPPYRGS